MNKPRDIEPRVFQVVVSTVRWARAAHATGIDRDLVRQLVRATTSVGANLEEARAGETKADFIHKVAIARKEAFEAHYWARVLLTDRQDEHLMDMSKELNQVAAILTAIVRRSRQSTSRGAADRQRR